MDNGNQKDIINRKKNELIKSMNLLGNIIASKIKEKNNTIIGLNAKLENTDLDYIAKYKTKKNKEFDSLKSELNTILKDIDTIITNITK